MNLALTLHALSRNNGISRVVLAHARVFAARGHQVHIYASRQLLSREEKKALPANIFLRRYPCLRGSNRIWSAPFGALLPYLRGGHDLLISHLPGIWQDVIVMHNDPQPVELERMSAVPFTVEPPRLRTKNRFLRTLVEKKRFAPGRYKAVTAPSALSARGIAEAYGVDPARLSVIRHGVDASYFAPAERLARRERARLRLDLSPSELVFVYIGDSWKGLEFAIKGLASGNGLPPRALVAAGPFHEEKFSALARGLGLRLICENDWSDIRDLYGAGDAFINPTPMDTFGLAALEALAMGLPVITTKYAGVSELLKDGENAFVLDRPWGVEEISVLARRLADGSFREGMGGKGAELAAGLSWERPALDHLALYERIRSRG